jgi:hypothetical protein
LAKYSEGAAGAMGCRGVAVAGSQKEAAAVPALELADGADVGVG